MQYKYKRFIKIYIFQISKIIQMKYAISEGEGGLNPNHSTVNNQEIDWNKFNYPVCLKLIHYEPDEIAEKYRTQIRLLWLLHILITVAQLLNLLTNIIATAQGDTMSGIRIGITVFLLLLWLPFGLYLFYLPYSIIMNQGGSAMVYYALNTFTIIWYFIWSIANFADANGFVRVGQLFAMGYKAAGVFGVFTSLVSLSIASIGVINMVWFYKR